MARILEVFLDIQLWILEGRLGLAARALEGGIGLGRRADHAQAATAAAAHGLDRYRVAILGREFPHLVRRFNWSERAGNQRHTGCNGLVAGSDFATHTLHSLGWRPDENESGLSA